MSPLLSAWSSLNLGEILWRGTCCNICYWCWFSLTLWRCEISSWL